MSQPLTNAKDAEMSRVLIEQMRHDPESSVQEDRIIPVSEAQYKRVIGELAELKKTLINLGK